MLLIKEVESKSKGMHYPESDVFRRNTVTFKTNMTGFLLKAEEHKSELEASLDLCRFCEEVRQRTLTWTFYLCNVMYNSVKQDIAKINKYSN